MKDDTAMLCVKLGPDDFRNAHAYQEYKFQRDWWERRAECLKSEIEYHKQEEKRLIRKFIYCGITWLIILSFF